MSLCLESAHSRSEILQDELKNLSRQHEEEIKKLIDENEKKIQGITLKASHERSECEYTTKMTEAIIWREITSLKICLETLYDLLQKYSTTDVFRDIFRNF